ncbi:hypothetical protein CLCR_02186 [Cladophialophora carrionii]|uniref:Uncharacterized protein n=1 Tax=Cladophialophora carrionii TaxID=86049 RepID=A0A1C1CDS7_9EURO|nr:hypothetical protein CLCR_02186 [Cladophialophora carrionii]
MKTRSQRREMRISERAASSKGQAQQSRSKRWLREEVENWAEGARDPWTDIAGLVREGRESLDHDSRAGAGLESAGYRNSIRRKADRVR